MPALVAGGKDHVVVIDRLEPIAGGLIGDEALTRDGHEGLAHGGAEQRPATLELLDELAAQPTAAATGGRRIRALACLPGPRARP